MKKNAFFPKRLPRRSARNDIGIRLHHSARNDTFAFNVLTRRVA